MTDNQKNNKGLMLGIGLAVIYGISLRLIVEAGDLLPGALSATFVILVPFVIGAISVFYSGSGETIGWKFSVFFPWLSILAFMATTFLTLLEGSICIILLLPIFFLAASIGGFIGSYLYNKNLSKKSHTMNSIAIIPLLLAFAETGIEHPVLENTITETIVINSAPEVIWGNIKNIPDISTDEFTTSFIYAIGVPFPQYGVYNEATQTRLSRWEKDIEFEEYVTEHIENEYMRWTYNFKPGDIPADALDHHVEIGGKYFDVLDTTYSTQVVNSQTTLTLSIKYRLSTNINWYSNLWASFLVRDFEKQILDVYKHRSEKS